MQRAMICAFLALAACDSRPSGGEASNAAASPTAAAQDSAVRRPASQPGVLEGEGLSLPLAGGGPAETLGFGAARESTVAALTRAFGRKPSTGGNEECGGGGLDFAEWDDALVAWFQDGKFAGWDARGELRTQSGLGIGATREAVARLEGFGIEESTLGTEFSAGNLGGIFESDRPDAKLTALWAGTTCQFR